MVTVGDNGDSVVFKWLFMSPSAFLDGDTMVTVGDTRAMGDFSCSTESAGVFSR